MEKELMADVLEEFQDQLPSYYLGWLLQNIEHFSDKEIEAVLSFLKYALQSADEDIETPRSGGSYQECRRKLE